ncbi:protein archease [Halobacteriales archaeon SW_8_68_21]|nr:MAG: protein archease [Halobacteriales archaeon SW_8_68_21]
MSYELRDHTADVAVEATADTPSALFAAVADGLTAASAESVPAAGDRFDLAVESESREALLFDYLDRLIYERDVRLVLPADHRCTVVEPDEESDPDGGDDPDAQVGSTDADAWRLAASARGVPLDAVAYVVFDV